MRIELTVPGAPRQKKNQSNVVFVGERCVTCKRGKRPLPLPAKPWKRWRDAVVPLLKALSLRTIEAEVNCAATFYCDTRRKVDAHNLYEGLADILEDAGIVADDHLIRTWDGSRVRVDRENPRTEVVLETLQV